MSEAPNSVTVLEQDVGALEFEHAGKLISGKFYPVSILASPEGEMLGSASSSSVSLVASSATVVTLLAANASRKGASIFNTSTVMLIKLGAAASTTSFTARLMESGVYEVPFGYTGIITGLWASADGNNAIITEVS